MYLCFIVYCNVDRFIRFAFIDYIKNATETYITRHVMSDDDVTLDVCSPWMKNCQTNGNIYPPVGPAIRRLVRFCLAPHVCKFAAQSITMSQSLAFDKMRVWSRERRWTPYRHESLGWQPNKLPEITSEQWSHQKYTGHRDPRTAAGRRLRLRSHGPIIISQVPRERGKGSRIEERDWIHGTLAQMEHAKNKAVQTRRPSFAAQLTERAGLAGLSVFRMSHETRMQRCNGPWVCYRDVNMTGFGISGRWIKEFRKFRERDILSRPQTTDFLANIHCLKVFFYCTIISR